MKVYVAVYEHRHGNDVAVFTNEATANAWRDELAREWWGNEFPDVSPDKDIGAAYFDRVEDEWFGVRECEVIEN